MVNVRAACLFSQEHLVDHGKCTTLAQHGSSYVIMVKYIIHSVIQLEFVISRALSLAWCIRALLGCLHLLVSKCPWLSVTGSFPIERHSSCNASVVYYTQCLQ